jgi:DNA invertase Pin-like site-specific DNA recombinase
VDGHNPTGSILFRFKNCLLVWRLDRLGRNLKHLISVVEDLEKRGAGFASLQQGIDTTTASGKLVFHVFGALAEFERGLMQERTKAGLAAARARGRLGGRKKKLNEKQVETMRRMYESKKHTVREICKTIGITTPTLFNYLQG